MAEISVLVKYKYKGGKKSNGLSNSSGIRLAKTLGIPFFTPKTLPKDYKGLVINYAGSKAQIDNSIGVLNHPLDTSISSNKLSFFSKMIDEGLGEFIPYFASSLEKAEDLFNYGDKVVCRTLLNSSCGKGIVIARSIEELVPARLYTQYFPKQWEFRVHILLDKFVCLQQKKRLSTSQLEQRGITERNKLIRNIKNGYIYSHNISLDINPLFLNNTIEASIKTLEVFALDFGAVDIIMNNDGKFKILEVNSCPGLEGTTLERYKDSFVKEFNLSI